MVGTISDASHPVLQWSVVAVSLAWPHLAYWIGKKAGGTAESETKNLYVDAVLLGLLVTAVSFRLWPATAIVVGGLMIVLLYGGVQLALRTSALCAISAVASAIVLGIRPHPDSEPLTTALSIAGILAYVSFVGTIAYRLRESHRRARAALREEEQKAHRLLLNVFPQAILPRLKAGESPIADQFADVTVLFADIVGYTPTSERLGPKGTVMLLNDLFRRFDQAAARLGVEKIETVGDGYLAVGGAPDPLDNHPEAVAQLALEMVAASREVPISGSEHVEIRVGLHTGPVFGGVVGEHRFHYAVFGETVNVASRIQSQSQPGRILVSEATSKRLRGKFGLEDRGPLDLKGHGTMSTYWLVK